jgi:hypothetical protein
MSISRAARTLAGLAAVPTLLATSLALPAQAADWTPPSVPAPVTIPQLPGITVPDVSKVIKTPGWLPNPVDAEQLADFALFKALSVFPQLSVSPLCTPWWAGRDGCKPSLGVGSTPVFDEEFDKPLSQSKDWVATTTSSYRYGNHNPDDSKLDWISPQAVQVADGVATFTARPGNRWLENGERAWTTGLLTTEGSPNGFMVRTGDYVEARVKLPTGLGAWPALWTWKDGGNEIDSFEYHPDNPAILELSNRVLPAYDYWSGLSAAGDDGWVTIGTKYGQNSVEWYVDGVRVYKDLKGVGPGWSAYLILNLSVSDGRYHPGPDGTGPIRFQADYVRVYR